MHAPPDKPATEDGLGDTARRPALLLIGLLGSVGVLLILIALGTWDPEPAGDLTASVAPGERTTRQSGTIDWLTDPAMSLSTPITATIRLEAAFVQGEQDSGYGLAFGHEANALLVAVSPLGYAAVWEQGRPGEPDLFHMPWRPWPHVQTATAPNEIWLDVRPAGGKTFVEARVNREVLWQGSISTPEERRIGLWLGSSGQPATVSFRSLELFTP